MMKKGAVAIVRSHLPLATPQILDPLRMFGVEMERGGIDKEGKRAWLSSLSFRSKGAGRS